MRPALLALLLLAPAPARAHHLADTRGALASVRLDEADGALHIEAMLWLHIPPSIRAHGLRTRFDLDRSRTLSANEGRVLANYQAEDIIGGFVVRLDDRPLPPAGAESSTREEPDGALTLAVLLKYTVPLPRGEMFRVELATVPTKRKVAPLSARLNVLAPLERLDPVLADPLFLQAGKPGLSVRIGPPNAAVDAP